DALLLVIAEGGELGGEIENCAEDGKSDQARGDVRMRGAIDVQIESEGAIESERNEQSVLNLEMLRFEASAKEGKRKHDGGESESGPIIGEESPHGGRGGERTEIGMKGEQPGIKSGAEGFFPARADVERIEIERDTANGEE